MLTPDGICLGVHRATGRLAAVSWREAAGGVLVTGSAWPQVSELSWQFLHAAIRRRRPVVVVDGGGSPWLRPSLAAVCDATGAPLTVFGPAGPGYYEPLRGGDPAARAALLTALIDWAQLPGAAACCQPCLPDLFAVLAAGPAPGAGVLEEIAALLLPGALVARARRIPPYHPHHGRLTERARAAANRLAAGQGAATLLSEQIRSLRASPLGHWLGPPPPGAPGRRIDLAQTVRQRGVALFPLAVPGAGAAAAMVASLVAADITALYQQLGRTGPAMDGLAWLGRCETAGPAAVAGLLTAGPGLATVLGTADLAAATRLAGRVPLVLLRRLDDPGWAARLAPLTGSRFGPASASIAVPADGDGTGLGGLAVSRPPPPGALAPTPCPGAGGPVAAPPGLLRLPAIPPGELCKLGEGEFVLAARGSGGAVRCRAVRARVPGPAGPRWEPVAPGPGRAAAAGQPRPADPGWPR